MHGKINNEPLETQAIQSMRRSTVTNAKMYADPKVENIFCLSIVSYSINGSISLETEEAQGKHPIDEEICKRSDAVYKKSQDI